MRKQPREHRGREVIEKAAEAAIGTIPIVGGPLAIAFSAAMSAAYERRMREWLSELAAAVTNLQDTTNDLDFDSLSRNEKFIDAVVHATRAAEGTHQEAKLAALRNAVLNAALPTAPDADLERIFLRYLDEFTPSHLLLLTFLNEPGTFYDQRGIRRDDIMMGGRSHLLERAVPEFAGRRDFYDPIAADLERAGLANPGLHVTMSGRGVWQPATTPRGRQFLGFITDPRSHLSD